MLDPQGPTDLKPVNRSTV